MAHSPLETFRRLANAGIFRVVKQAQPVLKTMPQLVADLMGALRSLRKVDTVVTARDGSRTVEALHEGTVKLSLARSAAFDPPVLENAVLQSRWSMLPHSDLPVATAAATLVVLDFDCTLTVRHMYHWLRTSAGKQLLEEDAPRFYDETFGGAQRLEKLEAFLSALGRAGATIVILSNGLGDEIRAALQHVRLYHFFWRVLASEEQAVAAKSAPAAASKASMLSRLAFEARGDFTNIIFADDDRDNFPPLDYVATTIPPASDYDGPFDYDGLLLVGSTWKLVTVHDTTGTAVAAATIPCPATKLVAWPVGEGEGGNGLAGDDLDAILRWVGADAPHASPPTIPAAALALAEDPTRAWEIASLEQRVYTFPTIRFSHPKPKPEGVLRFVCVSDTHGREMNGALPEGDVLLHAGDFSMTGRPKEVASFVAWLKRQPHRRKIVIAGNHDLTLDLASYPQTHSRFGHPEQFDAAACIRMLAEAEGVDYLCDSSVTVDGITVYGSPWQPAFGDWAFNLPRGEPCRERWRQIPTGADVVMTHGPALGHGDLCSSGLRAGCIDLLHELQTRVRPRYHVAGHIHEGFGVTTDGTTTYMNASTCTQRYKADNPPLVFDVPLKSAHQID